MKRICLVAYDMSVIGGVEQVTSSLANALCDRYEVHILSICAKSKIKYNLDSRIIYTSLLDKEDRLRTMRKNARKKIIHYFNKYNINIAIVQGTYAGYISSSFRLFTNTKVIFCDHGALMNELGKRKVTFMRFMSAVMSDKIVCLTKQNSNAYNKKFKIPYKKIATIANWIDLNTSRSLEYNTASKRVIAVGRFGEEKGFDLLVRIFADVVKKYDDWCLDIYGDGEMMPIVKDLIGEYQLEENIYLKGMREDVSQYYREYSMYAMTSYREGFPLVLLEAKYNYLPIVSFDIMTGPREIIRDGVDGILIPPYDLKEFSKAICSLIEDTDNRIKMSKHTQDNIEVFSKTRILDQWNNLFSELCNEKE